MHSPAGERNVMNSAELAVTSIIKGVGIACCLGDEGEKAGHGF